MSATGRNVEGNERHVGDFYATPAWCTRAILPHLGQPKRVLDPGCGTGAIIVEAARHWPKAKCMGVEVQGSLLASQRSNPHNVTLHCGNFFDYQGFYDLVIGNPPYNQAEAFAEHALKIGVTVALLLRINWLASKKRIAFHRKHPCDLYVLPRRPSFTNGGTDATEYAWMVWGRERGNRWFLLDMEDNNEMCMLSKCVERADDAVRSTRT